MITAKLPFSKIDSMIFGVDHKISKTEFHTKIPDNCVFIIPKGQDKTLSSLKKWTTNEATFILSNETIPTITKHLKTHSEKRIVFMSVTDWEKDIPDKQILTFLKFIQRLKDIPTFTFDVITVKSLQCPLNTMVIHPADSIYVGLGQTFAKERLDCTIRCFSIENLTEENIIQVVNFKEHTPIGKPLSFNKNTFSYPTMKPTTLTSWEGNSAFKIKGTYLIIGGSGGIGSLLGNYLAKNYTANLIIVGRRKSNQKLVDTLITAGANTVHYESIDIASENQKLEALIEKHPEINGIIHSALLLEDALLQNMSGESLLNVLKPKVHGTVNLIKAIKNKPLDFILFFSSIQSYIANAGQANYTAACVCKDALAALIHDVYLVDTKIINWGFWGNIGIVSSDVYRDRMKKLEISSIEGDEGLAIIERFMKSDQRQITVAKASDKALKRLEIIPHEKNYIEKFMQKHHSSQTESILKTVVPFYDVTSKSVTYNENMASALQEYSRTRLHELTIPERYESKFEKLVASIYNIEKGNGITREEILQNFPELSGHVHLIDTCLASLIDILLGKIDPLSIMFPDGSFKLVEPVYRDNPIADYFNKMAARTAFNYQKETSKPLKIIEIGAGTGSTTQFVLPLLKDHISKYTFTDLSFSFLNKARKRFASYENVSYEIYNVEQAPEIKGQYDIVIATNVIHATSNLNETIQNVHHLLNDDGIFILNEITSCQDYATLTFGLTDGWWLATDEYRIPNSPLLEGKAWENLLYSCGFGDVKSHGGEDQKIIVGYKGATKEKVQTPVPSQKTVIEDQFLDIKRVKNYIKKVIADVMYMDIHDIEDEVPFKEFGIDSIISMELINPFKNDLGYVPSTILFEYPSVQKLATYFIEEFKDTLATVLKVETQNSEIDTTAEKIQEESNIETSTSIESKKSTNNKQHTLQSIIKTIKATISSVLYLELDEIENDAPFKEMGIDSIISLELIKPLKEHFGYLHSTLLFEYTTVEKLAAYLAEQSYSISQEIVTETPQHKIEEKEIQEQKETQHYNDDDLVIVGMSGQFPDADNLDEFWKNLYAGKDSFGPIPKERWPEEGFLKKSPTDKGSYTNIGAFISDVEAFDNEFFNLTPLDAARIDPQERLFLQNVYTTMLDSGYSKNDLNETETGVFVGVMNGAYAWHQPNDKMTANPTSLFWSIANRVSYHYNWTGPSMAIDTACSSSLTALHMAVRAIQGGDCKQAIVGGVNLIVHPRQYELLSSMHMLSKSGTCKPFGNGADGFVDGEGICSIMVKKYSDAIADNDRIYTVIRGTSINSGGKSNGYTAPNPKAQATLIKKAISRANIELSEVGYVEAHGTGTELGDPIEIRALTEAYNEVEKETIYIGSVKSNIGHLESAAGLSGLIKCVLQMKYNTLVPSLHSEDENPHLELERTPFKISKKVTTFPDKSISTVSSFGAGGSNAHVILQQYPKQTIKQHDSYKNYIIPISSHTLKGLQNQIDSLRNYLHTATETQRSLDTIAYTIACTRDHLKYKIAFVVSSIEELTQKLHTDIQELDHTKSTTETTSELDNLVTDSVLHSKEKSVAIAMEYTNGAIIDWKKIYKKRRVTSLPGFSFEENRFWVDSKTENFSNPEHIVKEHVIHNNAIVPATWVISLLTQNNHKQLRNVVWKEILHSVHNASLQSDSDSFSLVTKENKIICSGEIAPNVISKSNKIFYKNISYTNWMEKENIYNYFNSKGYEYGKPMQGLQWAHISDKLVKGCIMTTESWGMDFSPVIIDSGLQLAILMPELNKHLQEDRIMVPYHLEELAIHRLPYNEVIYCYCQYNEQGGNMENYVSFDLYFTDPNNQLLIEVKGLTSVNIEKKLFKSAPLSEKTISKDPQEEFVAYKLS